MTREQLNKHWEVIEAYKNGAIIEYKDSNQRWLVTDKPHWNSVTEYRVKPTPKYISFTFEDVDKFIGKPVKLKNAAYSSIIITATPDGICTGSITKVFTYTEMLEIFTFLDGSPCGKLGNS